jgi:hypothetical protein
VTREVAVLFARSDSHYKQIPGADVWDIERDARRWQGGAPVVAHPPCRAWGRLQHFAKPREDERELGVWAVDQVRQFGGVLEHPAYSHLWLYAALPAPGAAIDGFGGRTLPIIQSWWGHRAEKATWLYIVGVSPRELPAVPLRLGRSTHTVSPSSRLRKGAEGWRPSIRKDEREHTPPELAAWLLEVARRSRVQ